MRVRFLFCVTAILAPWLAPAATAPFDSHPVSSEPTHWSLRPLKAPAPPPGSTANPIDRFIDARLRSAGMEPLPSASRATLIRRLCFDLTGLPPRPEEIQAFIDDDSPNACERLVDRLLAAPGYGERWAQHWLDIARFAETDGFEHDLVRPNAWRYRDWVIEALNGDMAYDDFVRLQIAGDEAMVAPGAEWADRVPRGMSPAVATGFLLCGPDMPDINLQQERRHNVLNEMTSAVGSVFLGLQFGCAQCHDHKYDPIPIADFYRLRAFFEPSEFFDEAPLASPDELAERDRLEAPIHAEREKIEAELKKFDATAHERLNKDPQVKISREEIVAALSETEREQFQKLSSDLKRLSSGLLPALAMGRIVRERGGTPRASHVMLRGDFRQPGPRVTPAFPAIANRDNHPVEISEAVAPSSGRRSALAHWLTRPDHPLTARVIVNRIWQFHFGSGLVRTPSDFGKMGEPPSHPDLLDWLASSFTRPVSDGGCGWSWKRLHKLIVTSDAYRRASRPSEPGWSETEREAAIRAWKRSAELDPENRWLARMNRVRLDGESIRDAMLAAAERLSDGRGGVGVRPPLPVELTSTLLKGQWVVAPAEDDHRRRSIYIFVRRNLRYPLFDAFDRPDTNSSCPQRPRSTTALQSLILLNSDFALSAARDLAALSVAGAANDRSGQVTLAYLRAIGRAPDQAELNASLEFLSEQAERLRQEDRSPESLAVANGDSTSNPFDSAALTDFCLALFNLNEFIYLD